MLKLPQKSNPLLPSQIAPHDVHTADGYRYIEQGDYTKATNAFEKALELNIHNSDAYHGMGHCMTKAGDYEQALYFYDRAVALSMQYHHFYHYQSSWQQQYLGDCLVALARHEEAKKAYESAIFQEHGNAVAHIGLAHVLQEMGDEEGTNANLAKAQQLRDDYKDKTLQEAWELHLRYSMAVEYAWDIEAQIALPPWLAVDPPRSDLGQGLWSAKQYYRQKQYRKAQDILHQLASSDDAAHAKSVTVWQGLANCYGHLDARQYATHTIDHAIVLAPEEADLYYERCCYALQYDDLDLAVEDANKALELDDSHYKAHFSLARCLFAKDAFAEALEEIERANSLLEVAHEHYHRQASRQHISRTLVYKKMGQYDLAVTDAGKAIDLNRDNVNAYYLRAECYVLKGNNRMAINDYQYLLENGATDFDNQLIQKLIDGRNG